MDKCNLNFYNKSFCLASPADIPYGGSVIVRRVADYNRLECDCPLAVVRIHLTLTATSQYHRRRHHIEVSADSTERSNSVVRVVLHGSGSVCMLALLTRPRGRCSSWVWFCQCSGAQCQMQAGHPWSSKALVLRVAAPPEARRCRGTRGCLGPD